MNDQETGLGAPPKLANTKLLNCTTIYIVVHFIGSTFIFLSGTLFAPIFFSGIYECRKYISLFYLRQTYNKIGASLSS